MEQPPRPEADTAEDWFGSGTSLDDIARRLAFLADPEVIKTLYLLHANDGLMATSELPADSSTLSDLNMMEMIHKVDGRERRWRILVGGRRAIRALWFIQKRWSPQPVFHAEDHHQ